MLANLDDDDPGDIIGEFDDMEDSDDALTLGQHQREIKLVALAWRENVNLGTKPKKGGRIFSRSYSPIRRRHGDCKTSLQYQTSFKSVYLISFVAF